MSEYLTLNICKKIPTAFNYYQTPKYFYEDAKDERHSWKHNKKYPYKKMGLIL